MLNQLCRSFGNARSGRTVDALTLDNGTLACEVITYGATLRSLHVPDRAGIRKDIVLGYDTLEEYERCTAYMGAVVGRVANRISGGRFTMNGQPYTLAVNDPPNHLHGGSVGFSHRVWTVAEHTPERLTLSLTSPDGEEGYPGTMQILVTYALEGHSLSMRYQATTDKETPCNLTGHAYFNLAGHNSGPVTDQTLCIHAENYTPSDAVNIPTGEIAPVIGTPMDFRVPKPIGQDLGADYECLKLQGGYDHNWEVFCNPCAQLHDPVSGRSMAVYTDCPGIQFYAGNFLDEQGKGGVYYGKNTGVALETQYYPDALHHPDWPQPITKAGERYHSETVYRFHW